MTFKNYSIKTVILWKLFIYRETTVELVVKLGTRRDPVCSKAYSMREIKMWAYVYKCNVAIRII